MKVRSLVAVLLLFGLTVSAGEYRDFLSADGKAIRAKILRYDAKSQKVTLERDNRKTATVPLVALSSEDQTYILQWEFNKVFLSESSFKIKAKRKEVKDKENSYSGYNTSAKVENTAYAITLDNKSTSSLKGLELNYCIYYEQEQSKRGGKTADEEGVRCGTLVVDTLRPKSSTELMTDPVSVYTRELDADWIYTSGAKNKITGKVRGIWVRVSMKTEGGDVITRDFCMPDSLSNSQRWTTSSVHVGYNKGN